MTHAYKLMHYNWFCLVAVQLPVSDLACRDSGTRSLAAKRRRELGECRPICEAQEREDAGGVTA